MFVKAEAGLVVRPDVAMKSTDLLVDGMLSGTGIRDAKNGGYIKLSELKISQSLLADLTTWQAGYEHIHVHGFPPERVEAADREGLAFAARLQEELPNLSVGYFSHGHTKRLL